jgi:hypothetical protein
MGFAGVQPDPTVLIKGPKLSEDSDEPDLRFQRAGGSGHRRRQRHGAGNGADVRSERRLRRASRHRRRFAAKEAERIVLEGGTAIGIACDVADEAQVAAMVDRAVAEYGRLDMAFNNAGIQVPPSDAADEPIENFERVTAVNQRGVCCRSPRIQEYARVRARESKVSPEMVSPPR